MNTVLQLQNPSAASEPAVPEYQWELRTGIARTKPFEEKKLAEYAVNPGLKCDHGCKYCSSAALLRCHPGFRSLRLDPFSMDYALIDPRSPVRVAADAKRKRVSQRGLVQLCTTVDAWSPAARRHDLGRECLAAVLQEPGWSVRVLTKSAEVEKDFDLIESHRERVLVGLSITGPLASEKQIAALEPFASPLGARLKAMRAAHARGLRTYGMLCPLLPGVGDGEGQIDEMVAQLVECGIEELFVEPVNGRGRALSLCRDALSQAGFPSQAQAVEAIRARAEWSEYAFNLYSRVRKAVKNRYDESKLRFLLYETGLQPRHREALLRDGPGIVWLGRRQP